MTYDLPENGNVGVGDKKQSLFLLPFKIDMREIITSTNRRNVRKDNYDKHFFGIRVVFSGDDKVDRGVSRTLS